mmetsp:Transcript_37124/g.67906  ORF Transcript_37124/g.67906 Transcript_37124/m.67906 type:complete len:124 (-) Transcript_37124:329-700(-)
MSRRRDRPSAESEWREPLAVGEHGWGREAVSDALASPLLHPSPLNYRRDDDDNNDEGGGGVGREWTLACSLRCLSCLKTLAQIGHTKDDNDGGNDEDDAGGTTSLLSAAAADLGPLVCSSLLS